MKRSSAVFLQVIIVLIGIGAFAFLLWEPHVEGRNVNSTLFEIYFKDPFLAYAYIASIPFFVALRQAFRIFGLAGQYKFISQPALKALRVVKKCAIIIIGFVTVGEIIILMDDSDDRAGGVAIGVLITFGSIVVASAAAMIEKKLQNAVDVKSANDFAE